MRTRQNTVILKRNAMLNWELRCYKYLHNFVCIKSSHKKSAFCLTKKNSPTSVQVVLLHFKSNLDLVLFFVYCLVVVTCFLMELEHVVVLCSPDMSLEMLYAVDKKHMWRYFFLLQLISFLSRIICLKQLFALLLLNTLGNENFFFRFLGKNLVELDNLVNLT